MRRFPWFEAILIIVVMSISLYAAFSDAQNLSWRWFTRDDAYYYFKVGQNISEGHGSTFDGINRTNGYHPLWMLVCIPIFALARFDLILPLRILLLVMSGLSVATGILLYRLVGRMFAPAIGAVAALFWVFSYDVLVIVYQQGLESGIAAFFIVLLAYKLFEFEKSWRRTEVSKRQIITLAIIAVLAMFSRLDLVFLAGIAGIWILFRGHLLRYFLPLDIISIIIATLLAFLARVGIRAYYEYVEIALTMVALGLAIKIPCAYFFGLYQRSHILRLGDLVRRLILSTLVSSAIVGMLMLTSLKLGLLQGSFSRLTILIDLAFTVLLLGLSRLIFKGLRTNQSSSSESNEKPLDSLRANWKKWLSDGALYYGVVLGTLALYMIWSKFTFGTSSPVSGQIKHWWASLPGRAYGGATRDVLSFFGINYLTDANAWNPVSRIVGTWAENMQAVRMDEGWRYLLLLAGFAILFFLLLLTNRRKAKTALTQLSIVPLFSSALLQILYYHALGYAAYQEWYWVSQMVVIVLMLSLILGMLYISMGTVPYRELIGWAFAAFVGISMGSSFWRIIQTTMPYQYWEADAPYMDIVPLLEEHTEPGSMIGFTGGGNTGYFIPDRTIVNMDGLINSYPYFQALQAGQAGEYLREMGVDYVLANLTILDQQPYKGQFNEYLDVLDVSYGGKQLMRYGAP